jgi:2-oxoisovalerate dehydrogenase E1 component alpha subunit
MARAAGGSRTPRACCILVGSQAPHTAGVAYAFRLRKEPRVAVCLFGDGATSKGDVWEAMNFAGVWKLPVVFIANNNQWAIWVPLRVQTASETLAQKARLGMPEPPIR